MRTAAALILYLSCIAALVLARAVTLLDGTGERWGIFALGCLTGLALWAGVAWLVADYLARKGRLL